MAPRGSVAGERGFAFDRLLGEQQELSFGGAARVGGLSFQSLGECEGGLFAHDAICAAGECELSFVAHRLLDARDGDLRSADERPVEHRRLLYLQKPLECLGGGLV